MIDFNNAESQNSFDLISANTIAKARIILKAGNEVIDHFITRSKSSEGIEIEGSRNRTESLV